MVSLVSRSVLVRIANSPYGATRRWHKLPKPSICSRKGKEGLGVYDSLALHCHAQLRGRGIRMKCVDVLISIAISQEVRSRGALVTFRLRNALYSLWPWYA